MAARYLLPRKNHFSQSMISAVSVAVIALVVWLTLLFLSVTEGLERNWIDKLTSISGPVRLVPTRAHYDSYYYQVDLWANASGYAPKSLQEKLSFPYNDPYDPAIDGPLPENFPAALRRDLVRETSALIADLGGQIRAVEIAPAEIHIRIHGDRYLSQTAYLTSWEGAEGLMLAKGWKESGVVEGDEATIVFVAPGLGGLQEMREKAPITSFFDPGIAPMGGKLMLAPPSLVARIRSATHAEDWPESAALQVHIADPRRAEEFKSLIVDKLQASDLDRYWTVQSYEEYDFAKDLVQQLKSDRTLFTLVALLIITVACSNIVSMLLLLVHDKMKEIGILRALGASTYDIALIFGFCGLSLGMLGGLVGTLAAYLTLAHLDGLVSFLSWIQGREAFNTLFFGDGLPSAMSANALLTIGLTTALLSLLAGLIPAVRAARIHPAEVLRG